MTATDTESLKGAYKNNKTGGWIVVTTPVVFATNEKDKIMENGDEYYPPHAGKLLIEGKNHTISAEVSSDHKVKIKFDDKVKKTLEHL